jgi:hypothetical protein
MREWTSPRYTAVVGYYQKGKAEAAALPAKPRPPGARRRYGDPFVVVVDPATLTPYTAAR